MRRIAREEPSEDEIERARELVKGRIVLAEESNAARMARIGRAALHDLPILTLDEMIERIDAVDGPALVELAGQILGSGRPSASCVGPDPDLFTEAAAVFETVAS